MTSEVLERRTPGAKALALTAIAACVLLSRSAWVAAYVVAAAAGLGAGSGAGWRDAGRVLRRIRVLLAAVLLFNIFGGTGEVFFQMGGAYATAEGLREGLVQAFRLALLAWLASLLLRLTSAGERIDAVERALRPLERRIPGLTQMLVLTLGFAPLMVRSAQQVRRAQQARGARVTGMGSGIRLAASAALPVFAGAFRRADDLGDAMASRGYRPGTPRTPFRTYPFTRADAAFLLLLLLPLLLLTAANPSPFL